jgi:hypothetical protein
MESVLCPYCSALVEEDVLEDELGNGDGSFSDENEGQIVCSVCHKPFFCTVYVTVGFVAEKFEETA